MYGTIKMAYTKVLNNMENVYFTISVLNKTS